MKEIVYLIITPERVDRMTKNLGQLKKGEFPLKVLVEVEPGAFRTPTVERYIRITDWREGIDIADVDLTEMTITEEEAQMIRSRRLDQMRRILEERGFKIEPPVAVEGLGEPPGANDPDYQ